MAKNYVQEGKVVTYANIGASVIYSGSVVVMGDIIGVALVDMAVGESGAVQIEEVFKLPKDTATAVAVGQRVFWDTATQKIVTAAGAVPAGIAAAEAKVNAATVNVKLNV